MVTQHKLAISARLAALLGLCFLTGCTGADPIPDSNADLEYSSASTITIYNEASEGLESQIECYSRRADPSDFEASEAPPLVPSSGVVETFLPGGFLVPPSNCHTRYDLNSDYLEFEFYHERTHGSLNLGNGEASTRATIVFSVGADTAYEIVSAYHVNDDWDTKGYFVFNNNTQFWDPFYYQVKDAARVHLSFGLYDSEGTLFYAEAEDYQEGRPLSDYLVIQDHESHDEFEFPDIYSVSISLPQNFHGNQVEHQEGNRTGILRAGEIYTFEFDAQMFADREFHSKYRANAVGLVRLIFSPVTPGPAL